jgi:hypothetical protein
MSAAVAVTRSGSRTFVTIGSAPVTASQSNGGKGWFGQGQVGCDYQFTAPLFGVQTVIGAFSDFAGGSITGSSSFPGVTGSEKESSTWAVGGRAGVLVTPRFLTYFDAGYTAVAAVLRITKFGLEEQARDRQPVERIFEAAADEPAVIGLRTQARFDGVNYNSAILGVALPGTLSLAARECAVNADRRRRGRSGYRCRA